MPVLAASRRAAEFAAGLIFAAVFLLFLVRIAARYALGWPMAWADELGQVLFVWLPFWACATLLPDREQIRFGLVADALPEGARRACAALGLLVVGGLFACSLPACLDYLWFLRRERTPVLGVPLTLAYACFGLFMVAVVVRSALGLFALLRRDPRAAP